MFDGHARLTRHNALNGEYGQTSVLFIMPVRKGAYVCVRVRVCVCARACVRAQIVAKSPWIEDSAWPKPLWLKTASQYQKMQQAAGAS